MAFYPNCGAECDENASFCNSCGNSISNANKCAKCGTTLPNNSVFCPNCGFGNSTASGNISASGNAVSPVIGSVLNKLSSTMQSTSSFFKWIDKKVYFRLLGIAAVLVAKLLVILI